MNNKQKNKKFFNYNFFPKNHKGWIKIVEAFLAILLMMGVMLIIIGEEDFVDLDLQSEIYESQLIVLRDIQMQSSLRQSVLDATTPIESDDVGFPQNVKDRMEYLSPNSLECKAKICEIELSCNLDTQIQKEIYAQSVAITSTLTTYDPKQLKLFCWRK
jgi:hypothetical protein